VLLAGFGPLTAAQFGSPPAPTAAFDAATASSDLTYYDYGDDDLYTDYSTYNDYSMAGDYSYSYDDDYSMSSYTAPAANYTYIQPNDPTLNNQIMPAFLTYQRSELTDSYWTPAHQNCTLSGVFWAKKETIVQANIQSSFSDMGGIAVPDSTDKLDTSFTYYVAGLFTQFRCAPTGRCTAVGTRHLPSRPRHLPSQACPRVRLLVRMNH
jgi:hypothetical protein